MIIHVETLEDKRLETYVGLTEIQLRNRLEPEKGSFSPIREGHRAGT